MLKEHGHENKNGMNTNISEENQDAEEYKLKIQILESCVVW